MVRPKVARGKGVGFPESMPYRKIVPPLAVACASVLM
jgi:hypothetical protein